MRLFTTTLFILIVTASSCKKAEVVIEPIAANSGITITEQKIRQSWKFIHSILNDYGTNPGSDTLHGQLGDYYSFNANNKAYSYWNASYDTVSYQVLNSSSMLYGGDTMNIIALNASEFVFKKVVKTNTADYENVIWLSK